jgi:hypothetical protein
MFNSSSKWTSAPTLDEDKSAFSARMFTTSSMLATPERMHSDGRDIDFFKSKALAAASSGLNTVVRERKRMISVNTKSQVEK